MTKKFGPMDIDFHKRCERTVILYDMECTVIRYGVTAAYMDGDSNRLNPHRDLSTSYADLSVGGRRSGRPIETDIKFQKHFFNKRIMTDEERYNYHTIKTVQGGSDVGGVGALYGEGSAGGTRQAEAEEGRAGGGDSTGEGNNS